MKITVKYAAQIKRAAGTASDVIELADARSVLDALETVTADRADVRRMILTETGALLPTMLVFVGDEQVERPDQAILKDGDVITLLSPIAGG